MQTADGTTDPLASEFKEPWKDPTTAFVLDPYEENELNFGQLAKEPRVTAIIHQATKGMKADALYEDRKTEGVSLGYKWGSYHLGLRGDPIEQANFYLATAKPSDDEVIALDIEKLTGSAMPLADAELFIKHIYEQTNRYPLLYVTRTVRDAILEKYGPTSPFAHTKLWFAGYVQSNNIGRFFPTRFWASYTLWQFASEINCPSKDGLTCPFPKPIPGTAYDMDVNVFYGTVESLRREWPFTHRDAT